MAAENVSVKIRRLKGWNYTGPNERGEIITEFLPYLQAETMNRFVMTETTIQEVFEE